MVNRNVKKALLFGALSISIVALEGRPALALGSIESDPIDSLPLISIDFSLLKWGKQAIRETDARKILDGRSSKLAVGSFSGFRRNGDMRLIQCSLKN